jgi:hypothetical protein
MTPRTLILTITTGTLLLASLLAPPLAQALAGDAVVQYPPLTPAGPPAAPGGPAAELERQLLALRPDDPMSYFNLGESIGYAAGGDRAALELARQLLLLAAVLDRASAQPIGLEPSVALALADLAGTDQDRRMLLDAAEALAIESAAGHQLPRWPVDLTSTTTDDLPLRVAQTLARARANDGARVRRELERAPIEDTLRHAGLRPGDVQRIMTELRIVQEPGHCPGCRSNRAAQVRTAQGAPALVRCPTCGGNPGASLSAEDYMLFIRAEALVLGVRAEGWTTDLFLTDHEPLRDTSFDDLLDLYRVDPAATRWSPLPSSNAARSSVPAGRWDRQSSADHG